MAKHHPDLIFCRKQAGVAIGEHRCTSTGCQKNLVQMGRNNIKFLPICTKFFGTPCTGEYIAKNVNYWPKA